MMELLALSVAIQRSWLEEALLIYKKYVYILTKMEGMGFEPMTTCV